MFNWKPLTSMAQVDAIAEESASIPCAIFKHSTRCSISDIAKLRLEQDATHLLTNIAFYYLDLLNFRDVSDYIAEKFGVYHESPQLLLIENGECVYDSSHLHITVDALEEALL